jgi:hypothetical protein
MGKAQRSIKVLVGDIPPYIERNAKLTVRGFDVELLAFKRTIMIRRLGTLEWLVIPVDRVEELRGFIKRLGEWLRDALSELYIIYKRDPERFKDVPAIGEIARIVGETLDDYIFVYVNKRAVDEENDC